MQVFAPQHPLAAKENVVSNPPPPPPPPTSPGPGPGPGPVTVPLTQELLADLVGGTRPSVNAVLQRLASRGVVELGRGRITVVDRGWLADRSR